MSARFEGAVLPVDRANVDTDQMVPAYLMNGVDSSGVGPHLFRGMSGGPELLAAHPDATIVVARENFGCGSSREHAVWALVQRGFRAVIAPSFARIFEENAYLNGVAPIVVDAARIDALLEAPTLALDLEQQRLTSARGEDVTFALDPLRKYFLLEGGYLEFMAAKRGPIRDWLRKVGETTSY
ncbi:MAG: 3-isopropylmalate dehydratase small subunit [Candidatus Eremiobacteraeota bacterium]|nr:3-isopropylmalate dehydratase small subunit [Candidatus Eremiobacteraeota bacterium]